jgi:hypothetical protein
MDRKTEALMEALKVNRREAVGIIGCLTAFALKYRPGGELEKAHLATAVEWDGDDALLLAALLDSYVLGDSDEDENCVRILRWEELSKPGRKSKAALKVVEVDYQPPVDMRPTPPDRASDHVLRITDQYKKTNPKLHDRGTVEAKIRAAVKSGASLQEIEIAIYDEARCKDVEIWNLLKPLAPAAANVMRNLKEIDHERVDSKLTDMVAKLRKPLGQKGTA